MNGALLLAALASVVFGASDYTGGMAARRGNAMLVTCFSGLGALAILLVALPFIHGAPSHADLAWGGAAGVFGAAGATLIYTSLALGPVSVASPVFCLIGLSVPVLFGVLNGNRPSALGWSGIVLAVISIPLLTAGSDMSDGAARARIRKTLVVASLAGLVAGAFLISVSRIGAHAGLAPLFIARATAIGLFVVVFLARRMPLLPPPPTRRLALAAGVLDSAANVLFWISSQRAPLALAATLVSLAPATTVLLARFLLGERWSMTQRIGLLVALVAGGLISHG
ncbi:MAG TPA: DMT family transporter [Candidatus Udaeobacter sp.]|nr:DMT family transporter [Candidatus Udaeobacter sp.]